MDAKRAEIAFVQAPVDWNGQAKQTLNASCYLDKAALNPVKVSPSQEVMSQTLRRRLWGKDGSAKQSSEIGRVDAATLAAVQKHKELQEGLTDEMVVLAAQLKDSSMLIDVSLQDTEHIFGSAETALEHTLASTDHVNHKRMQLMEITAGTQMCCFPELMYIPSSKVNTKLSAWKFAPQTRG